MNIIKGFCNQIVLLVNYIKTFIANKKYNYGFQKFQKGNVEKAFQSWKETLKIYQSIGNRQEEVNSLNSLGIATHTLGQYQQALKYLKQAVNIARDIDYSKGEVNSLGNLSNSYRALGNYDLAIDCLEKSLALSRKNDDLLGTANSLRSLGSLCRKRGTPQQAISYLEQSLSITQNIEDLVGEIDTLGNLGITCLVLGNYQKANQYFEQSLSISYEIDYHRGESHSLRFLADICLATGQYKTAVEYLEQSLIIAEKTEELANIVACLDSLGSAYQYQGQYQRAIEYRELSLEIARASDYREGETTILGNLGIVYDSLGQFKRAIGYYQDSLTLAREIGYFRQESNALGNLGNAYQSLDLYHQAIEYHQQSLVIARQIEDRQGEIASLVNLGIAYQSLGEYQQAIDYHLNSLDIAREISDRQQEANALGCLGNEYDLSGKYQEALEYHQRYFAIAKEIGDFQGQGAALSNWGDTLYNLGRLEQAESKLFEAVQIWESVRTELKDSHKVSIFEIQTAAYNLLQQVLVARGKSTIALEVSERGRTRAFVDLLTQRLSRSNENKNNNQSLSITATSLTIKQIQKIAREKNITLVEYSLVDSGNLLLIWVVNPIGEINPCQVSLEFLKQQKTSLSDLVIQARQFLGINETQSKKNSLVLKNESQINPLQQLYQLLIDPILEFLPSDLTDLIVFIPQGNLFLLPFAALQNAEEKFFIEQHTIVTIPSIQILDLLGDKENSLKVVEEEISALLVGNPQKMPVLPLIEPRQQLKNLPWAESEVNAIASLLNTKAITGKNATKVEILKQMPKANIIHLATHGLLDDIRQLGIPGAIAFASSDDNETDGFLTSGEIYNLKLNAQLVVLSACRTGQGKITGDGIIGLSRCLIAAGVKSVIVSLWNVGDRSTALLMLKFYQFFQQGITPTLALNQAQRWLLKIKKQELEDWVLENSQFFDPTLKINLKRKLRQLKDNESPFESPCHWAAFCIIGH